MHTASLLCTHQETRILEIFAYSSPRRLALRDKRETNACARSVRRGRRCVHVCACMYARGCNGCFPGTYSKDSSFVGSVFHGSLDSFSLASWWAHSPQLESSQCLSRSSMNSKLGTIESSILYWRGETLREDGYICERIRGGTCRTPRVFPVKSTVWQVRPVMRPRHLALQ